MKKMLMMVVVSSMFMWSSSSYASFVSGSTGADGAFNPSANTVVTLPASGILNYTTVNIPSGVTVTFAKNAANTPVYMLATGDVAINGTISVNGMDATSTSSGKGGPGGGDGGYGGGLYTTGGNGCGPGGGNPGRYNNGTGGGGGGGGFGIKGIDGNTGYWGTGGTYYGNQKLLPLIGGSGGGGGGGESSRGSTPGGGGGGAIVIASSISIVVNGSITANGGNAGNFGLPGGGGGSGGGIKLVSNIISGNGTINAQGGAPGPWGGYGGSGRIRIEAFTNNRAAGTEPAYIFGSPGNVFVSAPPSLTVTSVAGTAAPANPTGSYSQPDIPLPNTTTNPVTVNISAANIPLTTAVTVTVIPQYGTSTGYPATSLSGTQAASTATASVTLSTTYSNVITAQATFIVVGMYYNGEEIDKVRVAATLGGKSETTYITKSGKEIKVS